MGWGLLSECELLEARSRTRAAVAIRVSTTRTNGINEERFPLKETPTDELSRTNAPSETVWGTRDPHGMVMVGLELGCEQCSQPCNRCLIKKHSSGEPIAEKLTTSSFPSVAQRLCLGFPDY